MMPTLFNGTCHVCKQFKPRCAKLVIRNKALFFVCCDVCRKKLRKGSWCYFPETQKALAGKPASKVIPSRGSAGLSATCRDRSRTPAVLEPNGSPVPSPQGEGPGVF